MYSHTAVDELTQSHGRIHSRERRRVGRRPHGTKKNITEIIIAAHQYNNIEKNKYICI